MSKYDLLTVGSGLYAAVFASEAIKRGLKVITIEKRNHIGGNVYTERKDGIDIHKYGAHIFHTSNKEIWDYVNSLIPFKPFINTPIANYKGSVFNMPFNMNTFSRMWGITKPEEARKIIDEQRKEITKEPENLEEAAISLVGRGIYETLIKGYTEKQWGRDAKDLPPSIIKRIPVRYVYDNNYFDDTYQGIPEDGYTALISSLFEGVDIITGEDYLDKKEYWESKAPLILYTGALDKLYDGAYGALDYRSEIFEEERIETDDYQGVAVMNFTDRETPYTRIIEHKHFLKTESPVTWISKEYPVDYSVTGEPFYPINDEKNSKIHAKYVSLAHRERNLIIGGRLAEYRYFDMDRTIEEALVKSKEVFG